MVGVLLPLPPERGLSCIECFYTDRFGLYQLDCFVPIGVGILITGIIPVGATVFLFVLQPWEL
jgi:hypothetical protein